jgi:hypothetical protein
VKANLTASIRQRLLNRARQDQETFDAVLNRFGRERLCQCSSPAVVLGLPL